MTYSFVIPTYKQVELNETCLASIREFHPYEEIILVSDGDDLDTQMELIDICEKYNARPLLSVKNMGFAHSVNRGIDACSGDVAIIYNNDITLDKPIIKEAERIFKMDSRIGIIGCLLYYPGKEAIQHGGFLRFPNTTNFGHHDHNVPVAQAKAAYISRYSIGVTGAVQFIRKEMSDQIGVYSTKYMNCYEDVEFCLRAWEYGWRIYYSAQISAIHHEGYTRGKTQAEKKKKKTWESELHSLIQFNRDVECYDIEKAEELIDELNKKHLVKKKIGVARTWALGDAINAMGVIEKLKMDNPNSDIYFCTSPHIADDFKNNPNIKLVMSDKERMFKICDEFYDLDGVYENDPHKPIHIAFADKVFKEYDVLDVLPKMYSTPLDRQSAVNKMAQMGVDIGQPFVLLHPANSWASRTWSADKWKQLINMINTDVGYKIIIVGTGADLHIHNNNEVENVYNMQGMFNIAELREVIKQAQLVIGVDSSILHLAQTTDTKIVGIYSCANPYYRTFRLGVYTAKPNNDCKYCLHDYKGVETLECKNENKNECINSISSRNVYDMAILAGIRNYLEDKE